MTWKTDDACVLMIDEEVSQARPEAPAWLGDASIMCVGGALFGGEDWRSREIVGRVMKWRGFGLTWRNVYVAYPVP